MTSTNRLLVASLLACLPFLNGNMVMYIETGAPSSVDWADTFTRADDTDLTASCSSEGPGGDCGWIEYGGNTSIASNAVVGTAYADWQIVGDAGSESTGLNQYVAAKNSAVEGQPTYTGVHLRNSGGGTSGDHFYVLRHNENLDFRIRACHSTADCGDIAVITNANLSPAGTAFADGDSIGLEVSAATGDSVVFTAYHWSAQSPPSRGSWGTGWTVCASGCDQGFTTAPTATSQGSADTGKRGGIYDGNHANTEWDDWMFGDN